MSSAKTLLLCVVIACTVQSTFCGPLVGAFVWMGCVLAATGCYAAAGFVFGTVPIAVVGAVPALAACAATFATCTGAAVTIIATPTP